MPKPLISRIFNKKKKINPAFKRKNTPSTQRMINGYKKSKGRKVEKWLFNGGSSSYSRSIEMILKNRPIKFLKNIKNKKPKILILGAGEGREAAGLYKELRKAGKKPVIDVFSITPNTLNKKLLNKEVRRDLSSNVTLEQINKYEHSKLIKKLKDNYDATIAITSVGYHTRYPEYSVFTSASTLKKGGKTFIEINKNFFNFKNISSHRFEWEDVRKGNKSREYFLKKLLNINNRKEERELINKLFKKFINRSLRFLKKEYPKRVYNIEVINKEEQELRFSKTNGLGENKVTGNLVFALEITRKK
jgi:hypothetical protein